MSNQQNNRTQIARRTPKCVACEKAGLTGKALEHFPRKTPDLNSEIVCPTILAFKCGYCGQPGHSRGFCQALKTDQARMERENLRREQEEERRRTERRSEDERLRQATAKKLKNNMFTAFNDEEEDIEKEVLRAEVKAFKAEQIRQEEFPSLFNTPKQQQPQFQLQFAKMAANAAHLPVPPPKPKQVQEQKLNDEFEYDEDEAEVEEYTEYIQEEKLDSFDINEQYEKDANARKYFTPDHELEASIIKGGNLLFDVFSNRKVIEDDDNW